MNEWLPVLELPYICRVCTARNDTYIKPRRADDETLEITHNYHRVVKADCSECGQMRTHVIDWVTVVEEFMAEDLEEDLEE